MLLLLQVQGQVRRVSVRMRRAVAAGRGKVTGGGRGVHETHARFSFKFHALHAEHQEGVFKIIKYGAFAAADNGLSRVACGRGRGGQLWGRPA
jgi:hypothetical protein